MLRRAIVRAALAALCLGPGAAAAGPRIEVSPVLIELPAGRPIASLRIRNTTDSPTAFEARVFAWTQADGVDQLAESGDLAIWPPAFVVAARGEQIVRLAAQDAHAPAAERAYRLVLAEQPLDAAEGDGLRLRLAFSLPVFAAPARAMDAPPVMEIVRASAPRLRIANPGNRRIVLHAAGEPAFPRYLLAGEAAERALPGAPEAVRYAGAAGVMQEMPWPDRGGRSR